MDECVVVKQVGDRKAGVRGFESRTKSKVFYACKDRGKTMRLWTVDFEYGYDPRNILQGLFWLSQQWHNFKTETDLNYVFFEWKSLRWNNRTTIGSIV